MHLFQFLRGDGHEHLALRQKIIPVRSSDFGLGLGLGLGTSDLAVEKDSNRGTTFRDTKTIKCTLAYNAPEMLPHLSIVCDNETFTRNICITKPSRGTYV